MAFQALLRLQALPEEQRPDAVQEVGRENRQAVLRQADLVERTLEDPQGREGDGRGRYRLELEVERDLGHDSGAGSRDGERRLPILLLHQQIEKSKTRIRQKSTSLRFEISRAEYLPDFSRTSDSRLDIGREDERGIHPSPSPHAWRALKQGPNTRTKSHHYSIPTGRPET